MMTTLEYKYGGPPLVSEQTTFTEYLYVTGKLPPRYPVPSIHVGAHVLASGISDTGLLVVWFADHEVIAF